MLPLDVPDKGLMPSALLNTYNATRLAADGYTGKGTTIVFFAFDGFDQSDLDTFASTYGLPQFTPEVVGGELDEPRGETTMDLEVAHAVAPDARKVVFSARSTVSRRRAFEKIGEMFAEADRRFPGAIWSFSIGWGCDKLITAADLAPARSALANAQAHGTSAFNASGDLAGLECKGGDDWSSPPGDADVGLDSLASLPEMTDVGGTTLSTDGEGRGSPSRPGSTCRCRSAAAAGCPPVRAPRLAARGDARQRSRRRLTPDVAAVADPFTGVRIVFKGSTARRRRDVTVGSDLGRAGGGDESVPARQRRPVDRRLEPAAVPHRGRRPLPAFRDVTLGGNAVTDAGPGYDLVTGLGTPDVDNLVRNLLILQEVAP